MYPEEARQREAAKVEHAARAHAATELRLAQLGQVIAEKDTALGEAAEQAQSVAAKAVAGAFAYNPYCANRKCS